LPGVGDGDTSGLRQAPEFTDDPVFANENAWVHTWLPLPVPGCGRHLDENGYFDLQVNPGVKDRKLSPRAAHLPNNARLHL
jgi:hypothetical protein